MTDMINKRGRKDSSFQNSSSQVSKPNTTDIDDTSLFESDDPPARILASSISTKEKPTKKFELFPDFAEVVYDQFGPGGLPKA